MHKSYSLHSYKTLGSNPEEVSVIVDNPVKTSASCWTAVYNPYFRVLRSGRWYQELTATFKLWLAFTWVFSNNLQCCISWKLKEWKKVLIKVTGTIKTNLNLSFEKEEWKAWYCFTPELCMGSASISLCRDMRKTLKQGVFNYMGRLRSWNRVK